MPLESERQWLAKVESFVNEHKRLPSKISADAFERSLGAWLQKARNECQLRKETVVSLEKLGYVADKKVLDERKVTELKKKIDKYKSFLEIKKRRPAKKCDNDEERHLAEFADRMRNKFRLQQDLGEFSADVKMVAEAEILDGITEASLVSEVVDFGERNEARLKLDVSGDRREIVSDDVLVCGRDSSLLSVSECTSGFLRDNAFGKNNGRCAGCKQGRKIRDVYGNEDFLDRQQRRDLGIIDKGRNK